MNSTQQSAPNSFESEISLLDIVNFFTYSWKKLAIAAITGALLGLGGWFLLGNYQARLVLTNKDNLSVLSLKSLQQTLPNLAAQMLEKGRAPEGEESLYRAMSNPDWWKISVTPIYKFTKADIKDLGVDMREGSNEILFLIINGAGSSKEAAIQNAQRISKFIHQGGAFLTLEGMIRSQQAQLLRAQSDIDGKINSTLVELEYQQARLKSLEALSKRFPGEVRTSSQVVDPKDSGAKYLPISTQIIAINTDINSNTENIERLRDRKIQLESLRDWLAQAQPLVAQSFDGLELNQALLALEEKQRASLTQVDPKSLVFLDSVRSSLLSNEALFKFGLVESPTIPAKKSGMIKSTAAGLAGVFFMMLLVLVGQRVLQNVKGDSAK